MTVSKIQWTDETWNPVRGCTHISRGCMNCYAERFAARMSTPGLPFHGFAGPSSGGPRWTGKLELIEEKIREPLRWQKPRRVFVNSMSDLFHESLPEESIDRVFAAMILSPRHTFQVLTKRADRMRDYMNSMTYVSGSILLDMGELGWLENGGRFSDADPQTWPPKNVWLGVSAEDQESYERRALDLLRTPAAVRFLSAEPLLEELNLGAIGLRAPGDVACRDGLRSQGIRPPSAATKLDWVICGGESGPKSRPCDINWLRLIVAQCKTAGVPVFVKQIGARPVTSLQTRYEGEDWVWTSLVKDPKGGDPAEWPKDLRVREFPQ